MWQTILDLFTYPAKTIDHLLTEKNFVKSTQFFFLTMMIVSVSSVLSTYLMQQEKTEMQSFVIASAAISPIAGLLLTRLLFRILVRFGLLLVAKQSLPRDPAEHQQRARELYLLYPYHVLPSIIPALLFPLVAAPMENDSFHLFTKLILLIGYVLLSFGILIFQIRIMTLIVRSVYQVSVRQAFWGPILAYFFVFIGLMLVTLLTVLLF